MRLTRWRPRWAAPHGTDKRPSVTSATGPSATTRGSAGRRAHRGTRAGVVLLVVATGLAAPVASAGGAQPPRLVEGRGVPSGCNSNGQPRFEASKRLPPTHVAGFVRIYCNDFLGRGLPRAWGRFAGQPGGDPGAMFEPSHVVDSHGLLVIRTYRDRRLDGRWATGGVCLCGLAQTYGAYFVRSRVTGGGDDNDELLWPAGHGWPPEVDFNETSPRTSLTASYVHYDPQNRQIAHRLSIDLLAWHTWGVIWTPTSLTFTVDGRVWSRVTDPQAIPRVPMTLDIQEQTFCSSGAACPTRPLSLQVDWVTEFAPAR